MPNSTLSLTFLSLLLLFSFNSGGMIKFSYGFDKTWRVPKPSTTGAELEANMNFACAEVGALGQTCMMIQQGGPCCYPNNLINHASVFMNFYYHLLRENGRQLQGFWTTRFHLSQ
ncbi:hypothetical protein SLE2022_305490 [Rubroshorea leprosula]